MKREAKAWSGLLCPGHRAFSPTAVPIDCSNRDRLCVIASCGCYDCRHDRTQSWSVQKLGKTAYIDITNSNGTWEDSFSSRGRELFPFLNHLRASRDRGARNSICIDHVETRKIQFDRWCVTDDSDVGNFWSRMLIFCRSSHYSRIFFFLFYFLNTCFTRTTEMCNL